MIDLVVETVSAFTVQNIVNEKVIPYGRTKEMARLTVLCTALIHIQIGMVQAIKRHVYFCVFGF